MKKTVKSLLVVLLMGITLLMLTGCGGNKLVATKETDDESYGKYTEKAVILFDNNKVSKVTTTMEYENEDTATQVYAIFNWAKSMATDGELDGFDVKQDKNKITMEMDAKVFADQEGISEEDMTKEAVKKSLEENGYTVK